MFNTSRRKRRMEIVFIVGLAVLLILTFIGYAYAAYRIQRPIIDTGGVINQTYLWAESTTINGQTVTHKGVDFSYCKDSTGKQPLSTGELYGIKLTPTQPLAVVLVEQNDSGAALTASSNAFSTGVQDNDNYAPLIKSDFAGNSSGIVVQNAGSSSTSSTLVDVYYYDTDSSTTWGPDHATIRAVSSHVFWAPSTVPADQVASAWISGGDKLVSTVYETKPSGQWRMQHSGFLAGSTTVILPRIYKNHGSAKWSTGIQVQNTGTTQANVTVTYYDIAGTIVDTEQPPSSIQPTRSVTFYQPNNPDLPNEFVGSAVITSDQPIVAVVNVSANNGSGDAAMSYNGFNR